jgi:tetratricopeptide (TPR) repeat protein
MREDVGKGMLYASIGRYDEAAAIFDSMSDIGPDLLLCEAGALSRMGSFARALECIEKALVLNPLSADAWFLKGLLYYQRGNLASALGYLEESLDIDAKHV